MISFNQCCRLGTCCICGLLFGVSTCSSFDSWNAEGSKHLVSSSFCILFQIHDACDTNPVWRCDPQAAAWLWCLFPVLGFLCPRSHAAPREVALRDDQWMPCLQTKSTLEARVRRQIQLYHRNHTFNSVRSLGLRCVISLPTNSRKRNNYVRVMFCAHRSYS